MMGRSMSEGETVEEGIDWREMERSRMKETDRSGWGGGKGRGREGGSEIAFNPARFNTSDKFCRRIN